jgi:hypothetical protein
VFISPHYYYPHDHKWVAPTTPLEDLAHQIGLLNRRDPLTAEDLEGSGADFPERYKPFVRHADTIVTSPHKAYGTSTNDMILQLRRYRIEKIVLGDPSAIFASKRTCGTSSSTASKSRWCGTLRREPRTRKAMATTLR